MPDRARVEALIEAVTAGRFVAALRDFYHDDAVTQENNGPERRGVATLVAIEEAVLRMFAMYAHRPSAVLVDGDAVAVAWTFELTDRTGTTRRMEEVALQHWRGDRIARERFFYDPALPVIAQP